MNDLTSNPKGEKLEQVEIRGRTIHVSERTNSAFVEFGDELVSMTNLKAWNELMEKAKQEVIEDYEEEKTIEEKQLESQKEKMKKQINRLRREVDKELSKVEREF